MKTAIILASLYGVGIAAGFSINFKGNPDGNLAGCTCSVLRDQLGVVYLVDKTEPAERRLAQRSWLLVNRDCLRVACSPAGGLRVGMAV